MIVSGTVLRVDAREGRDGKHFHSLRIADESLRQNEGVVAVDVSEEQANGFKRGDSVSVPIAFVNVRKYVDSENVEQSFVTLQAPREWKPAQ